MMANAIMAALIDFLVITVACSKTEQTFALALQCVQVTAIDVKMAPVWNANLASTISSVRTHAQKIVLMGPAKWTAVFAHLAAKTATAVTSVCRNVTTQMGTVQAVNISMLIN